ncbi:hypothetical protein ACWD0J_40470 [Streptomyces sp. NPDC003011]
MIHEMEDIQQELHRLSHRPTPEEAPPVLCAFEVRTSVPVEEYGTRIKSVINSALILAVSHSFDGDDLPVDDVPAWFSAASGASPTTAPEFARQGMQRYAATFNGGRWELQEWLYQFDPDSEFRGWAWWDLTQSSDNRVCIWVDSWGESFFACDELRWAAYVSGGEEVEGPTVTNALTWVSQTT